MKEVEETDEMGQVAQDSGLWIKIRKGKKKKNQERWCYNNGEA